MEETVALIDKLFEEHKAIKEGVQSLEQIASDASAMVELEAAKDTFMPGRLDQQQGLQKLQESLKAIEKGLDAHFNREETALLTAFEKHGDREMVSSFSSLLLEHEDLRNRFVHSKNHVAELVDGGLARHKWEASAHDMRAHLSHTRKLLEAHAGIEYELFKALRNKLREKKQS